MRGKVLLRIAGASLLLAACYFAIRDIFEYFQVNNVITNPARATILGIFVALIARGTFIYVTAGFLLLGFSSFSAKIAYWSLQGAIWLIGISFWYQQNHFFSTWLLPGLLVPVVPNGLIGMLACSASCFILYIPLQWLLQRVFHADETDFKAPGGSLVAASRHFLYPCSTSL